MPDCICGDLDRWGDLLAIADDLLDTVDDSLRDSDIASDDWLRFLAVNRSSFRFLLSYRFGRIG